MCYKSNIVKWYSYVEHSGEMYIQVKRPENTIVDMQVLEDKVAKNKPGQWGPDEEGSRNRL